MPSRRQYLRGLAAAGVVAVAGCASDRPGRGDGSDASTTTDGDGPVATTSPPASTPTPTPGPGDPRWRTTVSGAATTPTLADGHLVAGTDTGRVVTLSTADGRIEWDANVETAVHGAPTVTADTALTVSGETEHQRVSAWSLADGTRRWEFAPNEWLLNVVGVRDGSVFVATADDVRASSGQTLYARSLDDGTRQWGVEVGDNKGGVVTSEAVYVPSVRAVDAVGLDGSHRWRYEGDEYQFATLSVTGDTVAFVTSETWDSHTVHGLDAETGERRWTFAADWRAYTTYATDGMLFVGGERVARLDPETGETRWVTEQTAPVYEATRVEETLYVGSRDVAALDVADGTVRWRTDVDFELLRVAGLTDGRVVVHGSASDDDRNRHVVALDAATGERAWTFAGESELTPLTVDGGVVYCGDGDELLALAVA